MRVFHVIARRRRPSGSSATTRTAGRPSPASCRRVRRATPCLRVMTRTSTGGRGLRERRRLRSSVALQAYAVPRRAAWRGERPRPRRDPQTPGAMTSRTIATTRQPLKTKVPMAERTSSSAGAARAPSGGSAVPSPSRAGAGAPRRSGAWGASCAPFLSPTSSRSGPCASPGLLVAAARRRSGCSASSSPQRWESSGGRARYVALGGRVLCGSPARSFHRAFVGADYRLGVGPSTRGVRIARTLLRTRRSGTASPGRPASAMNTFCSSRVARA